MREGEIHFEPMNMMFAIVGGSMDVILKEANVLVIAPVVHTVVVVGRN